MQYFEILISNVCRWINLGLIQINRDSSRLIFFYRLVNALCLNLLFQIFLSYKISTSNLVNELSWHNTDQVWVLPRLTYFYMSYCPLLKFSFPDFSLSSFDILIWNSVYKFVFTFFWSSSTSKRHWNNVELQRWKDIRFSKNKSSLKSDVVSMSC